MLRPHHGLRVSLFEERGALLHEKIEPYDFKDAVPFQTPYFAGYVADRYDVNMEECILF